MTSTYEVTDHRPLRTGADEFPAHPALTGALTRHSAG